MNNTFRLSSVEELPYNNDFNSLDIEIEYLAPKTYLPSQNGRPQFLDSVGFGI